MLSVRCKNRKRQEIGQDPERIRKIKSFKNKYTWEKINFLPEKGGWKKFQKNN